MADMDKGFVGDLKANLEQLGKGIMGKGVDFCSKAQESRTYKWPIILGLEKSYFIGKGNGGPQWGSLNLG